MGIFDFVEEAGEEIKAGNIKEEIEDLDLDVTDLGVEVDGSKVTITGYVPSNAVRKKIVVAVGNIKGVSKVYDDLEVESRERNDDDEYEEEEEDNHELYTVKKGDTLSKIAKEYYGDAHEYKVIFEANRPMLKDPNLIYPGQVLIIPL